MTEATNEVALLDENRAPLIPWDHYRLYLVVDEIVGGIPRNKELIARWQESRADKLKGRNLEAAIETTEAELGTQLLVDPSEANWVGFKEHVEGLVIENRQIKAALKEAANICKTFPIFELKKGKVPYLKALLSERVFVSPKLIPLGRSEPDDTQERAVNIITPQGPRTALKRVDVCYDVKLACGLKVLRDGIFTEDRLRALLEFAGENGLGADRSQGKGTFSWTLEAMI